MNIYEIAELAGVSIATVSRVINDSSLVSEKTKLRVRRVMEENDYTPNVFARGLGLNSMKTVGLVCPDVADSYMACAVACLERDLREYGYDCILCCSGYAWEDREIAVRTILQKRIDALVVIGSSYVDDDPDAERVEYIREAAKQVPVFVINGYIRGENVFCALCSDYEATRSAVAELLRSGRRNILFLSDSHSYSANQKRSGYEAALREAGVPVREDLVIYTHSRIDSVRDLLLEMPKLDIDAVFATEDGLAAGVLKYAKRRDIAVPKDLAIIGYNNSELAVCCDPELSSVDSRVDRLCKIVIDSLKLRLNGKPVNDRVYAKGCLIRRMTTDF